ncbi:MAG: cofactor assembly of complex C subunit B [Cyanobacteriota bacterium]|nr:cofactor assembly of complex C subunit B [Cyanobacteriota bacterium]
MPTPARVVLVCALVLLTLTLLNAGLAESFTPELQRAEVLCGMAAVGLMLVAVLWTRADPNQAKPRSLCGKQGLQLEPSLEADLKEELAWGSHMLLTATPAATVLVHWRDQVILRRGLLSDTDAPFTPGVICRRAMDRETTISLVNTTLFPGRHEFDPVLKNLPAVLIVPLGTQGIVVLGGWSERCFSQADEQWLEGWSARLRTKLESATTNACCEVDPA